MNGSLGVSQTWAIAVLALLIPLNPAHADFLMLQPGAALGKDTRIMNGSDTGSNTGASSDLITNISGNLRSIGLIEFDLSGLPTGSTIIGATLSLYHHSNSNLNSRYDVFRITSSWNEMTTTFESAPTYDPTAFSTLIIPDTNIQVMRSWNISSLVQGWVNGTFSNFGMWIEEIPIQGSASAYFSSSDDSVESRRPKLEIEFAPPVVPVPAGSILAVIGFVGLFCFRSGMSRRALSLN